ncbi:hypothetical protein PMAC_003195, partial [Pneumocystis sp. 'macacae']
MKNKVGSRRGSQEVARYERDKEVYTRHRGRVGEVGCEKNVYRGNKMVCTKQLGGGGRGEGEGRGRRGVEVGVQVRVRGVDKRDKCVHQAARYEVCTRHRGGMGEVGCEKSVYRGNKMVCTKHLVAVMRVRATLRPEDEQEVVEVKNRIELRLEVNWIQGVMKIKCFHEQIKNEWTGIRESSKVGVCTVRDGVRRE